MDQQIDANDLISVMRQQLSDAHQQVALSAARAIALSREVEALKAKVADFESRPTTEGAPV